MLMGDRGGCFARRIGRGPPRHENGKKRENIEKIRRKKKLYIKTECDRTDKAEKARWI